MAGTVATVNRLIWWFMYWDN